MSGLIVGLIAGEILAQAVDASFGPQVQNAIRTRYKKYYAAVAEQFGRSAFPAVNHDLQRLLGVVYADCGALWLKSLPDLPVHEDCDGSHARFKQLCLLQLADFRSLMERRDLKPEGAADAEKMALDLLLQAIPEVRLDDVEHGHVTEKLTEGFKALVERLTGGSKQGVPFPDRFANSLDRKDGNYTVFGRDVLRRYIEFLKNGENLEASRAFDFYAFGVLKAELSKLQNKTDSADVRKCLCAVQLEFASLGASVKEAILRLDGQTDRLEEIKRQQKDLLEEITRLRSQLNLLSLDVKPKYEVADRGSFLQMRFDQRQTAFIGRELELLQLFSFLSDASALRWWQVSGAAGQGKSRLALHLVDLIRGDWDAGFLGADALEGTDWNTIEVIKPTLIVVDYLASAGKADQFVRAFACLAGRVSQCDERLRQPLRFLILERQGYGKADESGISHGMGWYDQVPAKFQAVIRSTDHEFRLPASNGEEVVSAPLDLGDLEPAHMVAIANSWRAYLAQDRKTGAPLEPLTEDQSAKMLRLMVGEQHLQNPEQYPCKAWRPLFAMMIGQYITRFDEGGTFGDTSIAQILDQVLESEREEYWPHKDGKIIEYSEQVWNLSCLATMISNYEHEKAQDIFPDLDQDNEFNAGLFFGPFSAAQFEAANIVLGYSVVPKVGASGVSLLLGREPDLLGEFMVLKEFSTQLKFDRTAAKKRIARLVSCAFGLSPEAFVQFMIRVSEDFEALAGR